MATPKNYAAFVFVGFCAWRIVACSTNSGQAGLGGPGTGGSSFGAGGGGSGAQHALGGAAGVTTTGTGGVLNVGQGAASGANSREMDSSCHPIKTVPEKYFVTDSSVVTDTITTLTPVAIFIMQDRSSSTVTGMPAPASPQSWQNSTDAVTAFARDPLSSGLDIGIGVFPPMNGPGDCNTGSDCGTPVVPIASLPGNYMNIVNAYQTATPTRNPPLFTPTECALRGMINTCLQYMSMSPSGEKCVAVLVTDGTPTQCDQTQADLEAIIADGKNKGVSTYTLGLPGADSAKLDAFAMAGGTDKSIDVTGGAQAFVQALNAIRGKVSHQDSHQVKTTRSFQTPLQCQWKIPAPQMGEQPVDPKQVNVLFTPPGQPGHLFGHVNCDTQCTASQPPATCPPSGEAWYYDDEKAPTQIFLCPGTCASIKTIKDATFDLQFHCPQKPFTLQ